MAKISEYPALASITPDDLFVVVNDPSGVPTTYNIAATALYGNIPVAVTVNNRVTANTFVLKDKRTPANSSIVSTQGSIFFDDNYIYVTTANNVTKRASLASFS